MYRYELHMHTSEGSACGRSTGAEMAEFYIRNGYSGAVVTDHFIHGNTRPDKNLSWDDYIDAYASGYYNMKTAACGRDFDVFFGIEEKLDGWDEYLVLGITPEWLKKHPELKTLRGKDFFALMHSAGAFIIHAHPYRERDYMKSQTVILRPNDVDAIEVRNCGNTPECDRRGYEYAVRTGLPMTGGSDRHLADPDKPSSGVEVPNRCHTAAELIDAIRSRRTTVIDLAASSEAELTAPIFSVEIFE